MYYKKVSKAGFIAAFLLLLTPGLSQAAGTTAGTAINNLATLSYAVGAAAQPVIESSPAGNATSGVGNGTNTQFLVDRKVNFTVAEVDGAAIPATPGGTGFVLTFSVTNTGNAPQDFALTSTVVGTGSNAKFGGLSDAVDAGVVSIFADVNANGTYEAGTDTATFIDDLAVDTLISVFVVSGTVPNTALNGEIASYHLLATAHVGGGAGLGLIEAATAAGAQTLAVEDVLFADVQGTDTANDAARDGKHSAQSDFIVESAVITVTKSALMIKDPVNLLVNPQAIPGATVQYTIDIANAAAATKTASLTNITDDIDVTNLTLDATAGIGGAFVVGWSLTDGANTASGTLLADANAVDGLSFTTPTLTYVISTFLIDANVNGVVPALPVRTAGDLLPGETLSLTFQVTIK